MTTIAENWGATSDECIARYPCDDVATEGRLLFRAVSVKAPISTTFRWLCQLKCAPYSYDWLDNFGKESPRSLTEGAQILSLGERVMSIFQGRLVITMAAVIQASVFPLVPGMFTGAPKTESI